MDENIPLYGKMGSKEPTLHIEIVLYSWVDAIIAISPSFHFVFHHLRAKQFQLVCMLIVISSCNQSNCLISLFFVSCLKVGVSFVQTSA